MTPEYWIDWMGCLWAGPFGSGFYRRFDGHTSEGFCLWDDMPIEPAELQGFLGYTEPQPDWTPCTQARAEAMIAMWREAMAR